MSAQVIPLRKPAPTPESGEALLVTVSELHALITLDPILGASPVRIYFVFNPEARAKIAASHAATGAPGRDHTPAYVLVAYDFPFALHLLQGIAARVTRERAKQIATCSAGLQAESLVAAAAALGLAAHPVPGFDASALKAAFFANTQETVIQLFQLDFAA